MEYDIGQPVVLFIEDIRDDAGVLADPADLTLTIRRPDGTETTIAFGSLTKVSTGHWKYVLSTAVAADAGHWGYRFVATDPDTVGEDEFDVRPSFVLGGAPPAVRTVGVVAPWCEVTDLPDACQDYNADVAALEDWILMASDMLYDLTRRQWAGEAADVVRPCGTGARMIQPPWTHHHDFPYAGYTWARQGLGFCGCSSPRACGCGPLSEVRLPGFPVRQITVVKLDGQVLDASRYRLDDNRWLVYQPHDGDVRRGWPCCQRIDLPDTETATWSIGYTFGSPPPIGGRIAAATWACELSKAASGDKGCRLPRTATTVARQGVTVARANPAAMITSGQVGLPEVDQWVTSVLLGIKNRPGQVITPGRAVGHGMRRTR